MEQPQDREQKSEQQQENVKAVMFVPYTVVSILAKQMRDAENTLQSMTGYRLKIVERAGTKLEDILTKADPWQGQDCEREKCLLCATKQKTGKQMTQDCTRRNIVYETWCTTCQERDMMECKEQANGDMDKLKKLQEQVRLHKYVGETARSVFERGWEHVTDFENLSIKSHMLKHAVELHDKEDMQNIKFGIRILRTAKSSFERQIYESVAIQENRHHHLLNSRSEFNRCAVPRLMCKLGDKEYKKHEKEMEKDLAREETQVSKIRELIKERNKNRNKIKAPPPKRRELDDSSYTSTPSQGVPTMERPEKRKHQEDAGPEKKKRLTRDIREAFQDIRDGVQNTKHPTQEIDEQICPSSQHPDREREQTPPRGQHGTWESTMGRHRT